MKNLLFKELKLTIHPVFYLVTLLAGLILIPNWIYFMAMSYIFFIAITNIFSSAKANKDKEFSLMMPIRRRDIVKARIMSIMFLEIVQIIVAIPFAIINQKLFTYGNFLMDPNIAFFGLVFIMYALFNAIFFPMFYKTGYKLGLPSVIAILAAVLFATAVEFLVVLIPMLKNLFDGPTSTMFSFKLIVLIAGIVIFFIAAIFTYKASAKRFEKLDL